MSALHTCGGGTRDTDQLHAATRRANKKGHAQCVASLDLYLV